MSGALTALGGLLVSAGAGPITPPDIPGLVLWLKAQGQSYTDGNSVTTWTDSSGVGNNVASAGLNAPIFKTGIVGGRAVMRLSGADARFMSSGSLALSQPDTIFIVANKNSGTSASGRLLDSTARQLVETTSSEFVQLYSGGATNITGTIPIAGAFHVISCVFNGAASANWVDKVADGSGTLGTAGIATLYLGSDNTGGVDFPGDIAEVIIYNSALSTGDRQGIENYLGQYYGLF